MPSDLEQRLDKIEENEVEPGTTGEWPGVGMGAGQSEDRKSDNFSGEGGEGSGSS
jgi:hypothetical protein